MTRASRLRAVLWCNLALVGALVAVGFVAHSVGVWAEGVDYLADAAGVGLSLLAMNLAGRPATPRHPDGYPRATRYAALVNAGWLLLLSLLVVAGGAERLVSGASGVDGLAVLVVSGVACAVMVGGALLLAGDGGGAGGAGERRDAGADLSVRAVLLDTVADAAAAGGVAATGAVIYATGGNYWLDPTAALVIAAVVGYHAARLLGRIRVALQEG